MATVRSGKSPDRSSSGDGNGAILEDDRIRESLDRAHALVIEIGDLYIDRRELLPHVETLRLRAVDLHEGPREDVLPRVLLPVVAPRDWIHAPGHG